MSRQELDQTLSEFGKQIGLPDLAFDDYHYCCLIFDEVALNLEVDDDSEKLVFYTSVGQMAVDAGAEAYSTLLDANYFFKGTGGATLGVDARTRNVVLVYPLAWSGVTLARFEDEVRGFVDIAESWINKLAEKGHDAPSGAFRFEAGIRV